MIANSDHVRVGSLAFVFRIRTDTYVSQPITSSAKLAEEEKRLMDQGVTYDVEQFVKGFGWTM